MRSQGLVAVRPHRDAERVDVEGLPHVGSIIWPGQVLYSTKDVVSGKYKSHKLKGEEVAHIDQVCVAAQFGGEGSACSSSCVLGATIVLCLLYPPICFDGFGCT